MPEDKVAVEAAEAPVKSAREMLEDTLAPSEPTGKAPVEPESAGEVEDIISDIEPGVSESPETEQVQEESEADEILKETPRTEEDKSKVQVRIDRLTAELKSAREELNLLKNERAAKEGKTPEYTDAQLRTALKKAMEDGDADLVWDIMDYRSKRQEEKLVKMYEDEKRAGSEIAKKINEEWVDIKSQYQKYVDPKMPEIFPGSKEALNLEKENSLLYQVAMRLYWSNEPEKAKYYRGQPGGQRLAVADALTAILAKYVSKGGKTRKVERQLLKEKRKKNIVGEGSLETEEKPSRQLSDSERLEEVIEERRKFQTERGK